MRHDLLSCYIGIGLWENVAIRPFMLGIYWRFPCWIPGIHICCPFIVACLRWFSINATCLMQCLTFTFPAVRSAYEPWLSITRLDCLYRNDPTWGLYEQFIHNMCAFLCMQTLYNLMFRFLCAILCVADPFEILKFPSFVALLQT